MRFLFMLIAGFTVYSMISIYFHIIRTVKVSKYGRAVFKISSDKYKKSIKDTKEIQMNVAPFKEENKVYLPLRYVANSLGIKNFENDKDNKIIMRYGDKRIKVSNDNKVTVKNSHDERYQNIQSVKIKNDEFMVSAAAVKDMFGVRVCMNDEKDKIIIK